jgi:hypothetical protein
MPATVKGCRTPARARRDATACTDLRAGIFEGGTAARAAGVIDRAGAMAIRAASVRVKLDAGGQRAAKPAVSDAVGIDERCSRGVSSTVAVPPAGASPALASRWLIEQHRQAHRALNEHDVHRAPLQWRCADRLTTREGLQDEHRAASVRNVSMTLRHPGVLI